MMLFIYNSAQADDVQEASLACKLGKSDAVGEKMERNREHDEHDEHDEHGERAAFAAARGGFETSLPGKLSWPT